MATGPNTGSNVIRNPFANSRSDGAMFDEPGKRPPINQTQPQLIDSDPSITDLSNNDAFIPDSSSKKKDGKTVDSNDPMANLDSIWDNPVIDDKDKKPPFKGYLPDIPQDKFEEGLNKADFVRNIDPKHFAAVAGGGDGAVAAMGEIVNNLGRQVFRMSFNANSKMVKAGFDTAESRFTQDLIPGLINEHSLDNALSGASELARNPKYAPVFKSVKSQLTSKYPKATAEQIVTATNKYVDDMVADAGKSSGKSKQEPTNTQLLKNGSKDANWDDWFQS